MAHNPNGPSRSRNRQRWWPGEKRVKTANGHTNQIRKIYRRKRKKNDLPVYKTSDKRSQMSCDLFQASSSFNMYAKVYVFQERVHWPQGPLGRPADKRTRRHVCQPGLALRAEAQTEKWPPQKIVQRLEIKSEPSAIMTTIN